jgi:hypothetical protein
LAAKHNASNNNVIPQFPDLELMNHLIAKYFDEVNTIMPLLVRSAFIRDIENGLHYCDRGFASVLLVVCAIGSRYVRNPRVYVEGDKLGTSSGWKWFNQAEISHIPVLAPPRLTDIQLCAVRLQSVVQP